MFGPDDAFLTTILRLLRQLPIYPMFGRGLTRLQPAYVEDVAEAISRIMQRAETASTIFEFGGPRAYSYEEFLRAVAHQAGLAPRLIPIPLTVWHALAGASEEIRAGDFRNYPSYTREHGRPRQEMSSALRADIPAAFTLRAK
jgi:uncharacterized protein YbjT (DUF2867 family)